MVRAAAVYELGGRFTGDSRTFEILHGRALHDPVSDVRIAARERLAEFFPGDRRTLALVLDKRTLECLCDLHDGTLPDLTELIGLATSHVDYFFRGLAVEVLAQYFPDIPESFPLIRDRAVHDQAVWVRMHAVSALAKQFAEAPQVFRLLRERVFADAHPWVRDMALELVAAHAPTDGTTGELLRHRAINDTDDQVRLSALRLLAKNFGSDWRTFPMLRERAQWDPHELVRRGVVYLAAENFIHEPRTDALVDAAAYHDPSPLVRETALLARSSVTRARRDEGFSKRGFDRDQLVLYELEWRSNEDLDELWGSLANLRSRIEIAAAAHPRVSVRSAAMRILREKWQVSLDFILDRLEGDPDGSVRCEGLRLMAENGDEYAPILEDRAMNDPDGEVRAEAILLLAKAKKDGEFTKFLADRSPSARRAAVYAFSEMREADGNVNRLCQVAASDPDGRVRLAAVTSLSRASCKAARECLAERSEKDEDPLIVMAAREGIANSISRDELLEYLKCGEVDQFRLAAAVRLCSERGYILEEDPLWHALHEASCADPSPKNRKQLLGLLVGYADYPDLTAKLLQHAISSDPSEDVREAARDLLNDLY
jgi:hypothetical protein